MDYKEENRQTSRVEPIRVDHFWGHKHVVTSLLVLNDGSIVITGCGYGRLRVFQKEPPHLLLAYLRCHTNQVDVLAVSHDDSLVASAGLDRLISLVNVSDWTIIKTFKGHRRQIEDMKFSLDAKLLCSVGWDKKVVFWDLQKLKRMVQRVLPESALSSCQFSYKDKMVALGNWNGTVKLFSVDKLPNLDDEDCITLTDHTSKVTAIAFSRAGMMASGSYDCQVFIYHYRGYYKLFCFSPDGGWIRGMAFSPDSFTLATITDADYMVKVWDAVTQELEFQHAVITDNLVYCSFIEDGRLIAAGAL